MELNLKALVVILAMAAGIFYAGRPLCLRYMTLASFSRRRNTWYALTIVAFASPSFWIYALFAIVVVAWSARHDPNPLALYVLITFTIPDVHFFIPGVLVQQLFDLNQYRILSLTILLPVIFRMRSESGRWLPLKLTIVDMALIGLLLLQVVPTAPYESHTNTLRRTFLFLIDTFAVYYAFARIAGTDRIAEVVASFWLACLIMAPIAVFEWGRGWLLYTGLTVVWGDPNLFAWLLRGDSLRAQAAAGHSINLGYLMALSIGFYLYLRRRMENVAFNGGVLLLLAAALFVAGSRGPWVMAAAVAITFFLLQPDSLRKLAGFAAFSAAVIFLMYVTPLKEAVLDRLPFIGTADQETVAYRQRLAEISYVLIAQNPLFGDPFVALRMDALRQGQGIIDIVNGYLYAALFNGLVGLSLLVSVLVVPAVRVLHALRELGKKIGDVANASIEFLAANDDALLGTALVATMIGTILYIATAGISPTTFILAGLLTSYAGISRTFSGIKAQPQMAPSARRGRPYIT